MLKILSTTLVSWIFCINALADNLRLGDRVPTLRLAIPNDSTEILIGNESKKVYLLNFWATWCAPCKEEMPLLEAYYQMHKSDGLEVVAINMDTPRKLNEAHSFAKQFSFKQIDRSEADIKGLGRLWRLPSTFVIDKEGKLRKNGNIGDAVVTVEELDQVVLPLLTKDLVKNQP